MVAPAFAAAADAESEDWQVPQGVRAAAADDVAVMPMDNLSLEPGVEKALYDAVYERLAAKGYAKISVEHVERRDAEAGRHDPGPAAGHLGQAVWAKSCTPRALLSGRSSNRRASTRSPTNAIVVSCFAQARERRLRRHALVWRSSGAPPSASGSSTPVNALINSVMHSNASREARVKLPRAGDAEDAARRPHRARRRQPARQGDHRQVVT
jgi:hypothetical protein